ncbi:hypothetical protein GPECTOR_145g737 [Gonium pectorale]|uniref:BTB domain-containing protein n=1 Tax=Gonium pectorale TaxID=33097 RepID=A0A150FXW7_GONPE|nr:hypothetical protein GPECTOR_145g737 [Gonium pectorale]|eukprot:KXZ42446.1 hypothetical protein GPECTOR_145g737 [Gonium pectorale]
MRTQVLAVNQIRAVVARPLPAAPERSEVLVFCQFGICPLIITQEGHDAAQQGEGGNPAAMRAARGAQLGGPLDLSGEVTEYIEKVCAAAYNPQSDSVVMAVPGALLALDADDVVTVLAGDPDHGAAAEWRDGVDDEARIGNPLFLAAGGAPGVLYLTEACRKAGNNNSALRQVQLLEGSCGLQTTLIMVGCGCVVHNPRTGDLLFAGTPTSISRLLMPIGAEPVAGIRYSRTPVDGPAALLAHFTDIKALAADEHGNVFILDGGLLRVMRRGGGVQTLEWDPPSDGGFDRMVVLPDGRLALWRQGGGSLHLVELGREELGGDGWMPEDVAAGPSSSAAVATAAGGARKRQRSTASLAGDLGALLGTWCGERDGGSGGGHTGAGAATSDVVIIAGAGASGNGGGEDGGGGDARRSFPAHRAILAARCPYFRHLFAGGFADSSAPRVELPGAEPEALAAVLRHIYTGDPGDLAEGLLRPVAELADRLLLPELRDHVAARLVRSVTPGTVVDAMLWADRAGAGMEGLLRRLAAYFAAHRAEVAAQAAGGLEELVSKGSPGLLRRLLA